MTLRYQLLLLALLLAALPVTGWYTAAEIEAALRDAESRAQIASAQSLVRGLEPAPMLSLARGERLYVHRIGYPIIVDGFDDDWRSWLPAAAEFQSRRTTHALRLLLATDGRRLYGLAIVRDDTRSGAAGQLDHLLLQLPDGRRYRIREGIPGSANVTALDDGDSAPLNAAWESYGNGRYLVELSLPLSLAVPALGLAAVDHGEQLPGRSSSLAGTVDAGQLVSVALSFRSEPWSRRLAEAAPAGSRLWLLDDDGWVMAAAGTLRADTGTGLRGWRWVVYRWLSDQSLSAAVSSRDSSNTLRLDGPELARALASGTPGVQLGLLPDVGTVVTSVAVPVRDGRTVVGALVLESPSEGLLIAANRAFAGTVLASTLAVLVLGAGLLLFATTLSLRIRKLRDAAEAMVAGRSEAFPVSAAGDEIGDLSRSFARLFGELDEYNRYLQALAARLAHELGTPLAVVRSSLENLQHEQLSPDAALYADRAREGAERLRAILRALSEARRLEQALADVDREPLDLCGVVAGCFAAYRDVDPDHEWTLDLDCRQAVIAGSAELIAQALDKLADNARSFAPAGTCIRFVVEARGRGVAVRIANEGPPLPERLGDRVFDSMVSVRRGGGFHLGLGLHIVRLIVRAHGGRASARNIRHPAGVEFVIWLPLATNSSAPKSG